MQYDSTTVGYWNGVRRGLVGLPAEKTLLEWSVGAARGVSGRGTGEKWGSYMPTSMCFEIFDSWIRT